MQRKLKKGQHF